MAERGESRVTELAGGRGGQGAARGAMDGARGPAPARAGMAAAQGFRRFSHPGGGVVAARTRRRSYCMLRYNTVVPLRVAAMSLHAFALLLVLPQTPGPSIDAMPPAPDGRGAAAVAYAPDRRVLFVYGGIGTLPRAFDDVWELSPEGWQEVGPGSRSGGLPSNEGPGGRFNAAAAHHAGTGTTVIHGGGGIDETLADTWGWDGTGWVLLAGSAAGPPARTCARMVEHAATGDLVLFGGQAADGRLLDDTWTWNGRAWARQEGPGPPAACFHGMAYDAARGRTVLFGGRGPGGETWEWDGRTWHRAATSGPAGRDHHAMGYDPRSRRVVVHGGGGQDASGGWDGSVLSDTWAWDGSTWTRLPDSGPARMHAPGAVRADALGGLLLFGGSDLEESHADLWLFDGERWRPALPGQMDVDVEGPGDRSAHVLPSDPPYRSRSSFRSVAGGGGGVRAEISA